MFPVPSSDSKVSVDVPRLERRILIFSCMSTRWMNSNVLRIARRKGRDRPRVTLADV